MGDRQLPRRSGDGAELGDADRAELASEVDVLVTNLVPERQERYGLSYEDVQGTNSRLIYVALTGYGADGPERDRLGFDYAAFWARSGIMGTLGGIIMPIVDEATVSPAAKSFG